MSKNTLFLFLLKGGVWLFNGQNVVEVMAGDFKD